MPTTVPPARSIVVIHPGAETAAEAINIATVSPDTAAAAPPTPAASGARRWLSGLPARVRRAGPADCFAGTIAGTGAGILTTGIGLFGFTMARLDKEDVADINVGEAVGYMVESVAMMATGIALVGVGCRMRAAPPAVPPATGAVQAQGVPAEPAPLREIVIELAPATTAAAAAPANAVAAVAAAAAAAAADSADPENPSPHG